MPVTERHKYDQHKSIPSKSSQHELEQNLMVQSQKRYFPLLQGRVVPTHSVPKQLCNIASFAAFTNRMYKWMQVELQSLICSLLLLLFPERYRRSNEMWARARQRCVSRGAVLACSPWSRNNAEQAGGPSTGLATKKPRRYAEHLRKWCKANHQPLPKASL